MMGVGMDKRDIDLMNDEAFWEMNEETLNEQEFVTLRRVTPIWSSPVSMAGDRSMATGDIVGDRPPIARGDDGKKKERVHHVA
jgi:hypothetical protein